MSAEKRKAVARDFFEEVWDKRNLDPFDKVLATNFVYHNAPPGVSPDRESCKQWIAKYQAAFHDAHMTVEDQIAEGDKLVTRWTLTATHKGELMGIAPTGKQITMGGITISRFAGDKVTDSWEEANWLGLMQQLGVVPPMGEGKK